MRRIGVDIDEVLADTLASYLVIHNEQFGTAFEPQQFRSYRWHEWMEIELETLLRRVQAAVDEGWLRSIPPLTGAVEGVLALRRMGELVAITSRWGPDAARDTAPWLHKHFSRAVPTVHFARNEDIPISAPDARCKSEICHAEGVVLMIEDSLEYASRCAEAGVPSLLLDKPWNQGDTPGGVFRVSSWSEALRAATTLMR